jgi:threonine/homoserine/homoserine lactone efflux protein
MIDFSAVAAVFSVYVVGVVIPGPNFVAVAHKSVSATRPDAFALVAGIVVGNLFWATCAILGVGVVFAIFPWIAIGVKLAGAGYLIWFGLRLIMSAGTRPMAVQKPSASSSFGSAFMQGVATNIANPKSIAFYAAVFSTAAPAHVSAPTFLAMLATVGVVASCWYGGVALFLSHEAVSGAYRRAQKWIDRACGAVIVALGIRQALR